jgi:chromate reductase, NAD(P)H dehydrogenase (quinone)
MLRPKILVMAGSLRVGSHNGRLAALVAKELLLADADVTRISLADYPLPLLDADMLASSGPPDNAVKLKHMLAAHQGVFIASPEYTASVTPLLKNAIDWITRVRERTDEPYAAFHDRVFSIGSASARADGGLHALLALRQILEVGCGALVLPQQLNVGRADEAFDDMDNLRDAALTTTLKDMVRKLIDLAGAMPRAVE